MSLLNFSTSRPGDRPGCRFCGAGNLISFNWEYAKEAAKPKDKRDVSVFVKPVPLRFGTLYECQVCAQPWYLYDEFMNFVPKERIDLIHRWNQRQITIAPKHAAQLKAIGHTPPDICGDLGEFCEFPCAITTTEGSTIERAVVTLQRHAPFEDWRNCRLATDIAEVRPSPYALPLSVRIATFKADEISMGFAPTMVELPNGESMALNGSEHFFVKPGINAGEVALSKRRINMKRPPEVYNGPNDTVYFVADNAPGIP